MEEGKRKLHARKVGTPPTSWFGDMHHGQASDASSASGVGGGEKREERLRGSRGGGSGRWLGRRASRPLSAPEHTFPPRAALHDVSFACRHDKTADSRPLSVAIRGPARLITRE